MASYFSQKTGDFLWELALNNERPWFLAHRETFETLVNRPLKTFAFETLELMRGRYPAEDFGLHISRIYRDARRLFGRGPYKENMWFTIKDGDPREQGPCFWFEITPADYSYGMGTWDMTARQAQNYRDRIDADPARFEQTVNDLLAHGDVRLWGDEYKRPKADRGEFLNPWYNRKTISVGFTESYEKDMTPEMLSDAFANFMPLFHFLRNVCAETEE
ncbi:MAG: DUF2461 domain-containing protein [Clostridia bacterium]|nr:DUF2461 domain-containing protein [Clostridia bacterium]